MREGYIPLCHVFQIITSNWRSRLFIQSPYVKLLEHVYDNHLDKRNDSNALTHALGLNQLHIMGAVTIYGHRFRVDCDSSTVYKSSIVMASWCMGQMFLWKISTTMIASRKANIFMWPCARSSHIYCNMGDLSVFFSPVFTLDGWVSVLAWKKHVMGIILEYQFWDHLGRYVVAAYPYMVRITLQLSWHP